MSSVLGAEPGDEISVGQWPRIESRVYSLIE